MERVKKILHELIEEMEISETIKIKIVPMQQKIASLSFKTRVLRLNRKAAEVLSNEEIRYILVHELIHLKIKDVNHGSLFLHEIEKYYSFEEAYNFEIEVIKKLLEYCRRNRKRNLLKE